MKKINNLYICLLISLIAHTSAAITGLFYTTPEVIKNKNFEITFKTEKLPSRVYKIKKQKTINAEAVKEEINPRRQITEFPKQTGENEKSKTAFLLYQESVRQKIRHEKKYPRWALRLGHEGKSRVIFSVLPSGTITGLKLLSSSGFKELDEEALNAVKRANPFLCFPNDFNDDKITMELDIVFTIRHKE
ncbi:MAG: energy transducer TonB [Endomicrobiaceae bacterium]